MTINNSIKPDNNPAYGIAPASITGWVIGKSEDGLWWVVRLNPANVGAGCVLVSQSPADGTVLPAGTGFSTTWALQNTGAEKWSDGEVDLRYVGAAANIPLHQGSDIYDLAASVQPGDTYNISVSMIAPFETGVYGELWEVGMGSQTFCQFYVYITVP